MSKKSKRSYFKQKPSLYFDENFPANIIEDCKKDSWWNKNFNITSAIESGNQGKDDNFQFLYCKKHGFVLVTLDEGFWNDKKYPFIKIPGVIIIVARKNEETKIKYSLETILTFLIQFPLPKYFIGDSKFKVSSKMSIMKGRDSRTRAIKTYTISAGDTIWKVGKNFSWF